MNYEIGKITKEVIKILELNYKEEIPNYFYEYNA